MEFTTQEKKQYSRHLLLSEIGEEGQAKLKNAKVLVIGAGGLGCPVLQYIAAAGVGTIGIVDFDKVEQSNLQRQVLYTHDDIGEYKAVAAAKRLNGTNPYIEINPITEELNSSNAIRLFSKYDLIVDGTDNFQTRYLVNDACVMTNKPLVFGSIFKFDGQVSVLNYKGGPTYRCLFPKPPKPSEVPNCSEIGVMGVLPGIIGAYQANEVIKLICEIGDLLSGRLLKVDALTLDQFVFSFSKNEDIIVRGLQDNYDAFCGVSSSGNEITQEDFKEEYVFLDVRDPSENKEFNIGGLNAPLNRISLFLNDIEKEAPLVVYCKSGTRSKAAIEFLKSQGFKNELYNLKGGLDAYQQ